MSNNLTYYFESISNNLKEKETIKITPDSRKDHMVMKTIQSSPFLRNKLNEEGISLLITIKSNSNIRDDDYFIVNSKTLENSFYLENWVRHTFGNL